MKEQYLHSVRALLDCPPKEKERLLSRLDRALTAYLEDFPEAGETDLTASFGAPEACAARLLEECTPDGVAAERRKKNRRRRTVIAVLAVLLITAMGVTYCYWHTHGGYAIIQTYKNHDDLPDSYKDLPSNQVVYNYDD